MDTHNSITKQLVPEDQRIQVAAELFGVNFPMRLEPFVFGIAGELSKDYQGGYWEFYTLSNGGFYMAPSSEVFNVSCENGFEGKLSGDAFGITACLYAYSHLSFGEGGFAEGCAEQYHLLRDYMFEHGKPPARPPVISC